jgi:ribosomal protein S18 acetylase RimI-like enzyme
MESAIDSPWVTIFIAEDPGGRFLGHVLVTTNNQESSTGEFQGYVFDLSVIEEMQGKGVGKNLMKVAEDFCIKGGMRYVCLNVTTANENAVGFYEGLGYKEERKRMIKVLPEKPQLQAEALPAKEKEGGR